jgi:hypothetical protein
MTHNADRTTPPTQEVAPGLRLQVAADLFATMPEMAQDIRSVARVGEACLDYARRLRLGDTPEEAVTAMAYALSPRHGVWWGHECLKAMPDLMTPQDQEMLALCAAWVAEPDEPHRYACLNAAATASPRGPGAWLAMATGWVEGSMAPEDLPKVPPPLYIFGRALNAAILTALARVPQDKRRRMLDHYVNMAEVLAKSA